MNALSQSLLSSIRLTVRISPSLVLSHCPRHVDPLDCRCLTRMLPWQNQPVWLSWRCTMTTKIDVSRWIREDQACHRGEVTTDESLQTSAYADPLPYGRTTGFWPWSLPLRGPYFPPEKFLLVSKMCFRFRILLDLLLHIRFQTSPPARMLGFSLQVCILYACLSIFENINPYLGTCIGGDSASQNGYSAFSCIFSTFRCTHVFRVMSKVFGLGL